MNLSCMHPSADDGSHVTPGCEAVRKIGAVFSDDGGVDPYVVTSPQASCVANIHQRERGRVARKVHVITCVTVDLMPF